MVYAVDEKMPEESFVQLIAKKANVIRDHPMEQMESTLHSCKHWSQYGHL